MGCHLRSIAHTFLPGEAVSQALIFLHPWRQGEPVGPETYPESQLAMTSFYLRAGDPVAKPILTADEIDARRE